MLWRLFLSLGVLRQLEATPTSCLNASVQALSGLHFLLNGLLTFGTVHHATLLIFFHLPRLSVQLNVLISVAFLILRNCSLLLGAIFCLYVHSMFAFLCLVLYPYFVFVLFSLVVAMFPFGRLSVLFFSLVVPAICNFLLHIVFVFQQIKMNE